MFDLLQDFLGKDEEIAYDDKSLVDGLALLRSFSARIGKLKSVVAEDSAASTARSRFLTSLVEAGARLHEECNSAGKTLLTNIFEMEKKDDRKQKLAKVFKFPTDELKSATKLCDMFSSIDQSVDVYLAVDGIQASSGNLQQVASKYFTIAQLDMQAVKEVATDLSEKCVLFTSTYEEKILEVHGYVKQQLASMTTRSDKYRLDWVSICFR
jgi:hypothetical protein